jgi:hypothetical protein
MKQLLKNKRFEVIKALVESKKIKEEWLEDLYSILLMKDTDDEIVQTKYEIMKLLRTKVFLLYLINFLTTKQEIFTLHLLMHC